MAIYRLLQNVPLGPEEIRRLTDAYERTLSALSIKDRNDPLTEFIAKKIFELGQTGLKPQANFGSRDRGTQAFLRCQTEGTDALTIRHKERPQPGEAGAALEPCQPGRSAHTANDACPVEVPRRRFPGADDFPH